MSISKPFSSARITSVVAIAAMIGLCSCSSEPVQVVKHDLVVSNHVIEDALAQEVPLKPGEEAVTQWKFGCKTDFEFEIVEKTQLGDEFMVTVQIRGVKMTLTAPVEVWLPRAVSADTKKHEEAHVVICKRVYSHAEKIARDAAANMVTREFQGSGKTVEEACQSAIAIANAEIAEAYHLNTGEEVRRVSEILDSLDEHNHELPLQKLVDLSFEHYTRLTSETKTVRVEPKFVDDRGLGARAKALREAKENAEKKAAENSKENGDNKAVAGEASTNVEKRKKPKEKS